MSRRMKVGVIGCGNISGAYFKAIRTFGNIQITACADLNMDAAKAKASEFDVKPLSVDQMLSDNSIDIILNLTTPQAHAEINLRALDAGKHVHCEKPFATELKAGKKVLETAKGKKLYTGCAPDTFLGGGNQTCRKLIDDNWVGRPVAGTAFMLCPGHESWHPNPGFYYLEGGGPLFDMGPYYITALVNMLGPVKRVCASAGRAHDSRIATAEATRGTVLPVEVSTHLAGILDFHCGAIVTVVMSFDVQKHTHSNIEIYGTSGSLVVPDPNSFSGPVMVSTNRRDWTESSLSHIYTDNMRGIGVSDMADAIMRRRPNRCSGELAYHVLEVMHAFGKSSQSNRHVLIESTCTRPEALPVGLSEGKIA
ncbi:MAG: Gfo/Idh/MocA family oxidoreductase [Victivallales bacterium]|nr:Gfo/Idh/MocA family oxidoreductase [Victivallales bacterium]